MTHNDTKLNNMLFDDLGKGICMVDLDTMMSGEIIFDTGDVLRTMCNPSGEDGRMGPVGFDTLVYHNFIKVSINSFKFINRIIQKNPIKRAM